MKCTILKEAFFPTITMCLVYWLNIIRSTEEAKNYCIFTIKSLKPRPSIRAPNPWAMNLTILVVGSMFITIMQTVWLFDVKE